MITNDRSILNTRKVTDEGYLIADAVLCRTGVHDYLAGELGMDGDPMKLIRVYRSPKEVFSRDSIDSFKLKPITNNHPTSLLDNKTAKAHNVGSIGESVTIDADMLTSKIIITDKQAIDDINSGKIELSCGYTSDYDFTGGKTEDGQTFDAEQKNIRGNHLAIVASGRCGDKCKVLDSQPKGLKMDLTKVKINNVDCDVSTATASMVQQYIADMEAKTKESEEEAKKFKAKAKDAEEEKETKDAEEEKETKDAEKAKKDDEEEDDKKESMDAAINARIALIDQAKKVNMDGSYLNKDNKSIMLEALKQTFDGKSSDYITARFDAAVEQSGKQATMDKAVIDANTQKPVFDSNAAREKFINEGAHAQFIGRDQ